MSRGLALQRPYTPPEGTGQRSMTSILRPSDPIYHAPQRNLQVLVALNLPPAASATISYHQCPLVVLNCLVVREMACPSSQFATLFLRSEIASEDHRMSSTNFRPLHLAALSANQNVAGHRSAAADTLRVP